MNNLVGFINKENFIKNVTLNVDEYEKTKNIFSLAIIELKFADESHKDKIIPLVSGLIDNSIFKNIDCFSFFDNKFYILLPQQDKITSERLIKNVSTRVIKQYRILDSIKSGACEIPNDASNFTEACKVISAVSLMFEAPKETFQQQKKLDAISDGFFYTDSNIANNDKAKEKAHVLKSVRAKSKKKVKSREVTTQLQNPIFTEVASYMTQLSQKDDYLFEHSMLVARGCVFFAKHLGIAQEELEALAIAGFMHDIGYIAIPNEIYNKNSSLSDEEWKMIKLHPKIATDHILANDTKFSKYLPIVENHHEFIDGSGYPFGKKADEIPLGAQIMSIVDTFQAVQAERPYRPAKTLEQTIELLIQSAGIQWREELITIFTGLVGDQLVNESLISKENLDIDSIIASIYE